MRHPILIDGRRIISPQEAERLGFIYYGVGYSPGKIKTTISKQRKDGVNEKC
jgi:hypothetical protein